MSGGGSNPVGFSSRDHFPVATARQELMETPSQDDPSPAVGQHEQETMEELSGKIWFRPKPSSSSTMFDNNEHSFLTKENIHKRLRIRGLEAEISKFDDSVIEMLSEIAEDSIVGLADFGSRIMHRCHDNVLENKHMALHAERELGLQLPGDLQGPLPALHGMRSSIISAEMDKESLALAANTQKQMQEEDLQKDKA